jgi:hypothetical protein
VGQLAIAVQDIYTDSASAPTTIRAASLLHFRTPGYGPSILFPKQKRERGRAEAAAGAITTSMAATNKCLAQDNKSSAGREATNKRENGNQP